MTRGTIILVGDDFVLSSIEFNGDMYLDNNGHGAKVVRELKNINNCIKFNEFIYEFNKNNHCYYDVKSLTYFMPLYYKKNRTSGFYDRKNYINFNNDYFGRFFSDYIFIKSIKTESINVLTRREEIDEVALEHYINKDDVKVYYFGKLYDITNYIN